MTHRSPLKAVLLAFLIGGTLLSFTLFPLARAHALPTIPFGGKIIKLTPCANGAIAVRILSVSAKSALVFIWAPFTRTYLWGPPTHPGQNLLGIAGPPAVCVPLDLDVSSIAGPLMIQLGSSAI